MSAKPTIYRGHTITREDGHFLARYCWQIEGPALNGTTFNGLAHAKRWVDLSLVQAECPHVEKASHDDGYDRCTACRKIVGRSKRRG